MNEENTIEAEEIIDDLLARGVPLEAMIEKLETLIAENGIDVQPHLTDAEKLVILLKARLERKSAFFEQINAYAEANKRTKH